MKIGKETIPKSKISASDHDTIIVHGQNLCDELIGCMSFTEYFYFLLTGEKPNSSQVKIIDACLVSIAEHGLVPSVQAARMTFSAAPEAIQGAVAAGLLGCGSVILGAAEYAGKFFFEIKELMDNENVDANTAAKKMIVEYRKYKRAIPGYGHPLHKQRDPRSEKLFQISKSVNTNNIFIEIANTVENELEKALGKSLPLNISGAIPAVLLDNGFPVKALKGIPLLGRTAGLIGHLLEEQERPIGFALSYQASKASEYDGKKPDEFEPEF